MQNPVANLALFDLDNTLIAGDSDYLWGQFLVDKGIVDKQHYTQTNAKFYQDYQAGTLDINAFLQFSLAPLANHDAQQLYRWRAQFIEQVIKPIQLKPAIRLVNKHRFKGDIVMVITATNRFITEPITQLFGISQLLATQPELIDNQYTGNFVGLPCFRENKAKLLERWLETSPATLASSWFYSDSHNDLPLLKKVGNPVAVDPDKILLAYANKHHWRVISLR